ncbi:uncharacterized protein TM35_000041310 [Trypanosoma theileri]|uniref:Uncharacterized protein n=1 Tax=Trypanosoma theileri TaxID=67003 RepID=A0A1X0P4P7_9TRYP|nr:uncharacterized protein TM35_000041310 [Trypanosoma theileri]ORC91917.1 hypothetical protein TM35_000041310 [Trypanosoma theileri]
MTMMFVHLRRVVCLLVFLHFISVLVLAEGEKEVVTEVANNDVEAAVMDQERAWETYLDIPNFTREELGENDILGESGNADLKDAVWKTLVTVKESEIHFKNGTACMSEWKKVVEANEKTVKDAAGATERIKGIIKKIDEVADRETKDKYGKITTMKLKDACDGEKLDKLLQEIPKVLKETKEKAPGKEVVFKIAEAKQAELLCKATRSNVAHVLIDIERKVEGITTFVGDYNRSDKAMLVKRVAEGINATLRNVTALIDNVTVQNRFAVGRIKTLVQDWKEAYAELERLAKLEGSTPLGSNQKCKIEEKKSQLEEISGLIAEPQKEIKKATDTVGAVGEDAKKERKEYADEVNRRVTEAIKNVTTGMEEKKDEVAQEKMRREEEARRAAERAREEERARQAAEKDKEVERVRQAAEKAKEVERARQAAEKARLAAAQKAKEEKARQAAEKAMEEKAKRAVEEELPQKKKKKRDGSSSPALVHSPLLLLLLCVLGCTAVLISVPMTQLHS